jgi:3-dehydroquinate dehydratase
MRLSELPKPFICTVIVEADIKATLACIENAEHETDAFEVNLTPLNLHVISDIFGSTRKPCIATYRRSKFMRVYGFDSLRKLTETARQERLMRALSSGATAIDFELDMFDEQPHKLVPGGIKEREYARRKNAKPTEISYDRKTVERQKKLAHEVKSMGGEVVISCHSQTRADRATIFRIANLMQLRGANFGKIVVVTDTDQDLIRMWKCGLDLRREIRIPFNLMNSGELMVLGRILSVNFGSSWLYCRSKSTRGFSGQPTAEQARRVLHLIHPALASHKYNRL